MIESAFALKGRVPHWHAPGHQRPAIAQACIGAKIGTKNIFEWGRNWAVHMRTCAWMGSKLELVHIYAQTYTSVRTVHASSQTPNGAAPDTTRCACPQVIGEGGNACTRTHTHTMHAHTSADTGQPVHTHTPHTHTHIRATRSARRELGARAMLRVQHARRVQLHKR